MKSLTKDARITGLMYVFVIILAGFSQGYVRGSIYVPNDAAQTVANILQNSGLFRLGIVTDLLAFILDAVISVMFYQMLKPFGKTIAMMSSSLRLLAHPAIATLNLLNHYMALHVLGNSEISLAFTPDQIESLSLLFLDAHRYGYLIAGGFFGVHCFVLGRLFLKSGLIPKFFSWMMMVAALGYILETFGDFIYPGNAEILAWIVGVSAALGEVGLALYLLIKGVKDK